MVRPLRIASALLLGGFLAAPAGAQTPSPEPSTTPTNTAVPPARRAPLPGNQFVSPIPTDPSHPSYHPGASRTILRHNPVPKRTSYNSHYSTGGSAGYANPGGVGRFAEYYDQNTLAPPVDYHATPVARFDSGGGPDRAEQMQAQQLGIQRANSIQNHIDAYGRPIGLGYGFGFGYGLGLAGGRGYASPF